MDKPRLGVKAPVWWPSWPGGCFFRPIGLFSGRGRARMSSMTKWEYATAPVLTHATKQILDSWGEDGWELVTITPGPNPENVVAYFKREVE